MTQTGINSQAILEASGQGVLIFDSANRLVTDNGVARAFLGQDIRMLRTEGWRAAALIFETRSPDPDGTIEALRVRAATGKRPIRFHIHRAGEHVPCWISSVPNGSGEPYTMIAIDQPDWSAFNDLVGKYFEEVKIALDATRGHSGLITQVAKNTQTPELTHKRVSGFTRLIDVHMHRLAELTQQVERLGELRTGTLRETMGRARRKIVLSDFIDDFLEDVDDKAFLDPETDARDVRRRIRTTVTPRLAVSASTVHLGYVLRDVLRNAIMYSLKAAPITIEARESALDQAVEIVIADEGYGIRDSEREKVFTPFARARQPQIMGEFGYGLSLYLCKHEIEAMGGRIWFKSEEGVGTTFYVKLPLWRGVAETVEASAVPSSSVVTD